MPRPYNTAEVANFYEMRDNVLFASYGDGDLFLNPTPRSSLLRSFVTRG